MRRLLLPLLRLLFVPSLLRFINRRRVTILMLHGVAETSDDDVWQPLWPRPSPQHLDRVLGQLSDHYQFVSVSDAVDILAGRKPPINNALVVTFDDGYRNNVTEALPVLKKHRVPAMFYVATGFVETGETFWIDRMDYALQHAPESARVFEFDGETFDLRDLDRKALGDRYRDLRLTVKNSVDNDEQMLSVFSAFSASLESAAESSLQDVLDDDRFAAIANWREFVDAARSGVEIGSHTVNHNRLTAVDAEVVAAQLDESKRSIESRLGTDCDHFCYPNGDYDESTSQQVRDAGYHSAVTTERGLNRIGDDLMTLRRYPLPGKSSAFENQLAVSGFFELPVVRQLLG